MTEFAWRPGAALEVRAGGLALEAAAFGPPPDAAPTIVLLHEGLGALKLWRDFPAALAAATGWGVFAWSRQGYGRSPIRPPPWPLDYMTTEARVCLPEVLDGIGFRRGVLFGHSDGASIAAIHGGEVQDPRVRGLILMAPHFFTEPGGQASIAAVRAAFDAGGFRERMARHHLDADATFHGWAGAWLDPEFLAWNIEAAIDGFQAPTLAIQGREDEYGTLAHIEAIQRRSPASVTVEIVPDCRHAPHLEQPAATLAAARRFLDGLDV